MFSKVGRYFGGCFKHASFDQTPNRVADSTGTVAGRKASSSTCTAVADTDGHPATHERAAGSAEIAVSSSTAAAAQHVAVSGSPADAELEELLGRLQQVLKQPPDKQCDAVGSNNVLQQVDVVLQTLEIKSTASVTSQNAGKTADLIKSFDDAASICGKLCTDGIADTNKNLSTDWSKLGDAGGMLLTAASGAAYVGPLFALVGFALKQWSAYAQVPSEAVLVLRSCRDLLSDVHEAWPRLSCHLESKQRAQGIVQRVAQAVDDSIIIRQKNFGLQILLAQVHKEDLTNTLETLKGLRIDLITQLVLHLDPPAQRRQLEVGGEVYGIEQQEATLSAKLWAAGPDVQGLWLHGLGGSGKTTLATALYNRLAEGFEGSPGHKHAAFISLEQDDKGEALRLHLVNALKQLGVPDFRESAVLSELRTVLSEFVQRNRVLLVVDNVWTDEHLNALLPSKYSSDSRVIITSRSKYFYDSSVLQVLGSRLIYQEIQLLGKEASEKLFCHWSDWELLPSGRRERLLHLQQSIVAACGGLPLALRFAGGRLRRSSAMELWQELYEVLTQGAGPAQKLQDIATASFNRLSYAGKNMFLDVVSVMRNFTAQQALAIWRVWHKSSGPNMVWEDLQRWGFVTVLDEKLVVHEVVRALGQGIIRDPDSEFFASRVWTGPDGQLTDFGQVDQTKPLAALSRLGCEYKWKGPAQYPAAEWMALTTRFQDLHILIAQQLPPKQWDELCKEFAKLQHLQMLDLSDCEQLRTLPESVGQLTALQMLDLSSCEQLNTLPESIGQLTALQMLDLSSCEQLNTLPYSVGQLTALHELNLSYCRQLNTLPEAIGQLTKLQMLNLSSCEQLTTLPESIWQLTALQKLKLTWCELTLPDTIGQLTALQVLDLMGTKQLSTLPETIGQLTTLRELNLSYCAQLITLPESVGQLTALQVLGLSHCKQLSSLPETIGHLEALQLLHLRYCEQLNTLPGSIGQLTALQVLNLEMCAQLSTLPVSIGQLSALRKLYMSCTQLRTLPDSIGQLIALEFLTLQCCDQLSALPETIGQLAPLEMLDLSHCKQLHTLPEAIGQLQALQTLDLSNCKQLTALPESIGQLTSLQKLLLSNCKQLCTLPETIGQLIALQMLDLRGREQLSTLPETIEQLTTLQMLDLGDCEQLSTLPDSIWQLTTLHKLYLNNCQQLSTLPDSIGQLIALQQLDLSYCEQLSTLPENVGQLTSLQQLHLMGCKQLISLPESVGQLAALRCLNLNLCEQLSHLPESVGQLTALQELRLMGCKQLSTLPETIGQLKALQVLDLRNTQWKQLSTLPESIKQLTAGIQVD